MSRWWRPIAVMVAGSAATALTGLQLASSATPQTVELRPRDGADSVEHGMGFSAYDLSRLKILQPTLYHVEESYVEPGRIDWEAMFVSGMDAVERRVPAFLFHRDVEARRVSLEIGDFRTVLEVERIGSSRHLQQQLRSIAHLIELHLDPDDIPRELDAHHPEGWSPFAEVEYALVNGVLETLDPHTLLLPPPDASEMDVENQGEFGGLGITVVEEGDRLLVDYTTPGTPADAAGIHRGDVITRIDEQSTINMGLDDAVDLLRGPVGSQVVLEIDRESFESPAKLEIERQIIKLNEVQGELLEGNVGLVAIRSFHKHVESELHQVLARLGRESATGLRGVVLDLRGNPGGYLNQAVGVADAFLREGEIVSTVDGYGQKRDIERAHDDERTQPDYPMVVLLDANSASASEVVAGALRNNERAVIVGERSFGKGSVQSLHRFYDASKLKLTISQYLTPGDRSIQALGIPADIELVPVHVGRGEEDDALVTRVYWRENARREADLDHSLASMGEDSQSAYSFAYLEVPDENADPYHLDTNDAQVGFARDLILAADSSRRAEILANAARVVDTYDRRGDGAIVDALQAEGIDWTDGRPYTGAALPFRVRLDVQGGRVEAGERRKVTLHVTNTSDVALHRVGALARDNAVLDGREFLLGRIGPGETRSASVFVYLVDGYPTEFDELTLSVRDAGGVLGEPVVPFEVRGRDLPAFAWSWKRVDGELEAGQRVRLQLDVQNVGGGPTGEAVARIRNRSGKRLDIVEGTLRPGKLRTLDGKACQTEDRLSGCQLRLLPGESWSGEFVVELRERGDDPWELELALADEEAYDHASVVDAGFYEHWAHIEPIVLDASAGERRVPPVIDVSRAPDYLVTTERSSVSGVVEDPGGLRHVLVFAGGDKVFAQAALNGLKSVPFTADLVLQPGTNRITVVAEDMEGFTTTRSVVTFRGTPETLTRATARAGD